ncbi:hypothetical protein ACM258_12200 [Phaeobacter piscinae]|uniref:hypothetical protein n=1 Tax=Phaeobacter piscinae TaxID=1580596 RepID=UPI0039F6CF1E
MLRRLTNAARALTRTAVRGARLLLPVAAMIGCLMLLQAHVALPDLPQLRSILGDLAGWQWAGALLATGISFWALGAMTVSRIAILEPGWTGLRRAALA